MPRFPDAERARYSHVVGVVAPGGTFCHQVAYNPTEPHQRYLWRMALCGKNPPISGWQEARDDFLEPCERCV